MRHAWPVTAAASRVSHMQDRRQSHAAGHHQDRLCVVVLIGRQTSCERRTEARERESRHSCTSPIIITPPSPQRRQTGWLGCDPRSCSVTMVLSLFLYSYRFTLSPSLSVSLSLSLSLCVLSLPCGTVGQLRAEETTERDQREREKRNKNKMRERNRLMSS